MLEEKRLNHLIRPLVRGFAPPDNLTVSQWADKHRRLSAESSAEPGPWRTERTPYLRDPMDAFTDPHVERIVVVAASQVGKTELELNIIGYIIHEDPGSILFIHPSIVEAEKFSRQRIAPMIRDCKVLKDRVADVKTRDSANTLLQKTFPGGVLTIIGSNSASALSSTSIRYVVGDERDRWAISAGTEGDPWALAQARQTTYYNRKAIEVSTPTVKGASNIEKSFYKGTREHWCHECPHCGEYSEIDFDNIKFIPISKIVRGKKEYSIEGDVQWCCPECGALSTESVMRRQKARWIARNPEAYMNGVRSYWLNAFCSPWTSWKKIVIRFLNAQDDPEELKVVFNTLLGKLWENREKVQSEEAMLERREAYSAELPDGVLCLTCGVDTQDNRLEYEVVGYGHYGESWGIKRGFIMGRPDSPEVWRKLDDIIQHVYRFNDGKGLQISMTLVDSGGHFTQEVYENCRARQGFRVFACKGKGGEGYPFTSPPSKVPIRENRSITCHLFVLGVDAGKATIMANLQVQEPGAKYCHFPLSEEAGYDANYFSGLLSEQLVATKTKNGVALVWKMVPGHNRNEALDCRNYANAAMRILNPNMDALEQRLKGVITTPVSAKRSNGKKRRRTQDEW